MEEHSDLGLVYGQHRPFGQGISDAAPIPDPAAAQSGMVFERLFLSWNFIPCLEALVRKSALDDVGDFDEDPVMRSVEDFELWLRLARRHRIQFVPGVTSRYRFHGEQLTSKGFEDLFLRNLNIAIKFRRQGWVGSGLFIKRIGLLYLGIARYLVRQGRWRALWRASSSAAKACRSRDYILV
jgi:GT2 family glycosyltransferase